MGLEADARGAIRLGEHRPMGALLLLILISVSVQLAAPETDLSRLIVVLLQGATLLGAFWVSGVHKRLFEVAALVVIVSVGTALLALLGDDELGAGAARIVTLLLVGLAPAAIAYGIRRDFAESGAVTLRTMFGVLCIYLLAGMFFSFCFNVVQQLSDDPFFSGGVEGDVSDFLYYSFTTLTTTGFGDFTAATKLGRSLSVSEALVGQIYLVTVVAVIVANLRPRRRTA